MKKHYFIGWKFCFSIFLFMLAAILAGCNMFSFMDSPSGDEQLLSKARACFDQGDLDCALENYQKLSDDQNDIKYSEMSYVQLKQLGIDIGTFFSALQSGTGSSSGAGLLNNFAAVFSASAGLSMRQSVYAAYQNVDHISNNQLRGLVRFMTGLGFLAELLAEIGGTNGLQGGDLVSNATTCATSSTPTGSATSLSDFGCVVSTACENGTNTSVESGYDDNYVEVDEDGFDVTQNLNLRMLHSVLKSLLTALGSDELAVAGDSENAGGSLSFVTDMEDNIKDVLATVDDQRTLLDALLQAQGITLDTSGPAVWARCYRFLLVSFGIGG